MCELFSLQLEQDRHFFHIARIIMSSFRETRTQDGSTPHPQDTSTPHPQQSSSAQSTPDNLPASGDDVNLIVSMSIPSRSRPSNTMAVMSEIAPLLIRYFQLFVHPDSAQESTRTSQSNSSQTSASQNSSSQSSTQNSSSQPSTQTTLSHPPAPQNNLQQPPTSEQTSNGSNARGEKRPAPPTDQNFKRPK